MNVSSLNLPVYELFFRRQVIEIHFSCRGKGFNYVFKGIAVHPCSGDRNKDGDFSIGEEQWEYVPLAQIV